MQRNTIDSIIGGARGSVSTERAQTRVQGSFPRGRRTEVGDDIVHAQRDLTAAIVLCIATSGLDPKDIYTALGIDAPTYSRIMSRQAHFAQDKLIALMELCENHIPLRWLARRCGYELKLLQSVIERQNEELRQQLVDRDRQLEAIKDFVRSTRT